MRRPALYLLWVVVLVGLRPEMLPAQKTVWDGVFADSQAVNGKTIYTQYCATCHAENLSGGAGQGAPPLKGDKFVENWREDSLDSLFTKIQTTMPRRDPKRLNDNETLDLVAYIMQANEFPTGGELKADSLSGIQIQRKDGPKPLPNYAIVQVVGCMAQDADNWILNTASAPKRLRNSEKATPEELKAAEKITLGTQSFRLQNLTMLGAFNAEAHKGHKMMAKGTLIRQSNSERISVTELEMISASCGS